jgi:small subunit ribosomal protein S17
MMSDASTEPTEFIEPTDGPEADEATEVVAAAPAEVEPPTAGVIGVPAKAAASPEVSPADRGNGRKVREGIVSSTAMDKTAIVRVVDRVSHSRYAKTMQRTSKLYVHDEANDARTGDRVRVAETRPLSKLKRWRIVEILERAK